MSLWVLGMHRSGTSALTGSLEKSGLHLGTVHQSNPHNKKGNRENQQIMDLNNAILDHNSASWDNPPTVPLTWLKQQEQQRNTILQQLKTGAATNNKPCYGFKDPRTLLTHEFWSAAIDKPQYIGTFRHPLKVAQSLNKRSGMPIEKGLSLWLNYNQRLLSLYEQSPFDILSFDQSAEKYQQDIKHAGKKLGLTANDQTNDFFDDSLRTSSTSTHTDNGQLPPEVERLYKKLNQIYYRHFA